MPREMEGAGKPGEVRIGTALAEARARAGLELAALEERTKVRAKYLRALEAEQWEELPSTAHAKGFLRTYADALGLDAELLVDEFRRQVEPVATAPGGGSRRLTPAVLVIAALAAVAIAVVVLTGGDEEEPSPGAGERAQVRERERAPRSTGELVRLELRVRKAVEVCLLGAGAQELIDGQLLIAGSRDAYASESFQLRFPAGFNRDQVELELNGRRAKLPRIEGPARLRITPPDRVRQASPPGESCP
jgi:hypothetical protein